MNNYIEEKGPDQVWALVVPAEAPEQQPGARTRSGTTKGLQGGDLEPKSHEETTKRAPGWRPGVPNEANKGEKAPKGLEQAGGTEEEEEGPEGSRRRRP